MDGVVNTLQQGLPLADEYYVAIGIKGICEVYGYYKKFQKIHIFFQEIVRDY